MQKDMNMVHVNKDIVPNNKHIIFTITMEQDKQEKHVSVMTTIIIANLNVFQNVVEMLE